MGMGRKGTIEGHRSSSAVPTPAKREGEALRGERRHGSSPTGTERRGTSEGEGRGKTKRHKMGESKDEDLSKNEENNDHRRNFKRFISNSRLPSLIP